MEKLLETRDLVTNFYTYEGVVRALNSVNITVNHGETFGLVGESGCGKSVTVRSIMRIIQAPGVIESGEVVLYDEPGAAGDELLSKSEEYMQSLRGDRISMIFQEPNAALNPVLSIGEQISESFLFHRTRSMSREILENMSGLNPLAPFLRAVYGVAAENPKSSLLKFLSRVPLLRRWDRPLKREALKRSVEIIAKLGIPNPEEVVMRYPHELSGGMKQRIVIAIALACNPTLLIADEATSNLDVTIQAQILELLAELKKTEISSILLITHDLGVVAETCDRVGVMYAGDVCEIAPVRELFKKPRHPYSMALLNSVPRFHMEGELATIDGSVPNLVTPPPGCRFHPRCPRATEVCTKSKPPMIEVGDGHTVACHYLEGGEA